MNNAITGKNSLDTFAAYVSTFISSSLEQIFGPRIHSPILGRFTYADLGIFAVLLLMVLVVNGLFASWLRRRIRANGARGDAKTWHSQWLTAFGPPVHAAILVYGIYLATTPLVLKFSDGDDSGSLRQIAGTLFDLGVFACLFWTFFRLTRVVEARLAAWAGKTESKFDDLLVPLAGQSLRVILPVVGIIFALPIIGLPPQYAAVVAKGSSILIIIAVAWILSQSVGVGEKAILAKYDIKAADNLHSRKVFTQAHVISKTLHVFIAIFTAASVLMLFEEVRQLGKSILASAGVLGIIIGFAAQRTIANLFAGFQLAMTQPIRMDDVVIVESEWGHVEEITLTYVVIHIWDDRRLIVPLSYFIEKPFQNWTRVSAQLLGSVILWMDYTLPIAELRPAIKQIVEASPLWDRRFWNLQVSDANEHAMQIRILATAADSSKAWDLRCEIREKLIEFIQKHHPHSLPQTRVNLDHPNADARRDGLSAPSRLATK